MSDDRHSPTTAAPTPEPAVEPATEPAVEPASAGAVVSASGVTPEPTPTVSVAGATAAHPPGTAAGESGLPFGIPSDRPEILVGAAFAGGLVAAFILKRLGGD
jgi:hypothetical protein